MKVAATSLVTKLKQNEIKMFPDVFAYIDSNIERNLRLMYEITIAPIKFYLGDVQKYKLWSKLESSSADDPNDGKGAEELQVTNANAPFNASGATADIGDNAPSYGGPLNMLRILEKVCCRWCSGSSSFRIWTRSGMMPYQSKTFKRL